MELDLWTDSVRKLYSSTRVMTATPGHQGSVSAGATRDTGPLHGATTGHGTTSMKV